MGIAIAILAVLVILYLFFKPARPGFKSPFTGGGTDDLGPDGHSGPEKPR